MHPALTHWTKAGCENDRSKLQDCPWPGNIWNCLWAEFSMRELFVKSARASLQVCRGSTSTRTRELGLRWCDCTRPDRPDTRNTKLRENSKSFWNEFACNRDVLHWCSLSVLVETWGKEVLCQKSLKLDDFI